MNYLLFESIDLLINNSFCYNYDFSAANNSPLVNEYSVFTSSRFVVLATRREAYFAVAKSPRLRKIIISRRKIINQ